MTFSLLAWLSKHSFQHRPAHWSRMGGGYKKYSALSLKAEPWQMFLNINLRMLPPFTVYTIFHVPCLTYFHILHYPHYAIFILDKLLILPFLLFLLTDFHYLFFFWCDFASLLIASILWACLYKLCPAWLHSLTQKFCPNIFYYDPCSIFMSFETSPCLCWCFY